MQISQFRMEPLANDLAISHNDRTHQRIRTDPPPPALSKLKRPPQVLTIRSCKRRSHTD
jgi:hypothetical protein